MTSPMSCIHIRRSWKDTRLMGSPKGYRASKHLSNKVRLRVTISLLPDKWDYCVLLSTIPSWFHPNAFAELLCFALNAPTEEHCILTTKEMMSGCMFLGKEWIWSFTLLYLKIRPTLLWYYIVQDLWTFCILLAEVAANRQCSKFRFCLEVELFFHLITQMNLIWSKAEKSSHQSWA